MALSESLSGFHNTEHCDGNFHFVYLDPKLSGLAYCAIDQARR